MHPPIYRCFINHIYGICEPMGLICTLIFDRSDYVARLSSFLNFLVSSADMLNFLLTDLDIVLLFVEAAELLDQFKLSLLFLLD